MPALPLPAAESVQYQPFAPATRTIYIKDVPSGAAGVGALLDAILQIDRGLKDAPPPLEPVRRTSKPRLALVKNGSHSKP